MTLNLTVPTPRIPRPRWREVVIFVVNEGAPGYLAAAGSLSDAMFQDTDAQKAIQAVAMGNTPCVTLPGVTVRYRPLA